VKVTDAVRHQRQDGEGWPSSERVFALLLPFDADGLGLTSPPGGAGSASRRRRPAPSMGDRQDLAIHESRDSRLASSPRPHLMGRQMRVGRLSDLAGLRDAATGLLPSRPQCSSSSRPGVGLPASWLRPVKTREGDPQPTRRCTGLVLSGYTKFKIGRSGHRRAA